MLAWWPIAGKFYVRLVDFIKHLLDWLVGLERNKKFDKLQLDFLEQPFKVYILHEQ